MQEIHQRLEAIASKVSELNQLIDQQKTTIVDLRSQLEASSSYAEELMQRNEELENNHLNLQKSSELKMAEENTSLRLKLDGFIQDIDECITRLKA